MSIRDWAAAAFVALGLATPAAAVTTAFDLSVDFGSGSGFTSSQRAAFTTAERIWEYLLPGYRLDLGVPSFRVRISAAALTSDGPGGVLGSAGPNQFFAINSGGAEKYLMVRSGAMNFDPADLASLETSGQLTAVILHEMAHVLGFGTAWNAEAISPFYADFQKVSVAGTGQYTGAAALAAYRARPGNAGAAFIPVERGGGPGTADGHWDERDGGINGDPELMTGWLNADPYLSTYSLASFDDIGYVSLEGFEDMTVEELVMQVSTIPLPAGAALMLGALGALALVRRRR